MTRMMIQNPQIRYDRGNDVMHVYFPPSAPSYDDEDYPGIVVRRSMTDERITGVTLLSYSRISRDVLTVVLPFLDLGALESAIKAQYMESR